MFQINDRWKIVRRLGREEFKIVAQQKDKRCPNAATPKDNANLWIILGHPYIFSRCIQAFIGLYDRNTCLFVFPGPFVRKEEAVRGLVTEVEQKYGEISGKEKSLRFMTVVLFTCVLWHVGNLYYWAIHFNEILIKKCAIKRQISLQRHCVFVQYFIEFFFCL